MVDETKLQVEIWGISKKPILARHHHHYDHAHIELHSQIQKDTAHAWLKHIPPCYMF